MLAFGLLNAAYAGSVNLGFASDYFYRGDQKTNESVQTSLGLSNSIAGFKSSLHLCTNQSIDSGSDSYHMGGGFSKSFAEDLLSAYVGLNHFEDVPGDALSELQISVSSSSILSPTISVFRDLDDTLYTFELEVSHSFDLDLFSLSLDGSIGNTEISNSVDRDYYTLGLSATKSLSENADLSVGVDHVDSDASDEELVLGASLSLNF